LGDGVTVLARGIDAAFEADPFQIHLVTRDGFGNQAADQVTDRSATARSTRRLSRAWKPPGRSLRLRRRAKPLTRSSSNG
jgi:hypothetical protein